MAKLRTHSKKHNGIKIVVKKLLRNFLLGKISNLYSDEYEEIRDSTNVPEDVKEGHVAVLAVCGDETKRFIVPLNYLTHPTFIRLLEQTAEEYGFDRKGALTIPCQPSELEKILAEEEEQWHDDDSSATVKWSPCNSMLKSC